MTADNPDSVMKATSDVAMSITNATHMTADNGAYVKPGVEARRLVADANLTAVGCSIWSRSRVGPDGDPVGGLVCRISHWDKADEDTGEIEHRITYITRFDGDLLAAYLLDAADVDPSAVELVNHNRNTKIVRRICRSPRPHQTRRHHATADRLGA